jgi:hypothetical protein
MFVGMDLSLQELSADSCDEGLNVFDVALFMCE